MEEKHSELLLKCRQNDKKAQFALYKLYCKQMYNVSFRLLNNTAEAEDAMQEAFLSAFQHLRTYNGSVTFGAWLKRIVINKALDYLKKRKIRYETFDEIGDVENGVEEQVDYREEIQKVRDTVQKLKDGYRIVLSLYLFEGFDHEEIGQILHVSPSTSRSQLTRAKKKLLELLKNEPENEINRRFYS